MKLWIDEQQKQGKPYSAEALQNAILDIGAGMREYRFGLIQTKAQLSLAWDWAANYWQLGYEELARSLSE